MSRYLGNTVEPRVRLVADGGAMRCGVIARAWAGLLGFLTWVAALHTWAVIKIPQQDLRAYYSAGHHLSRGGALIYARPRPGRVPFIYPPLAALPFHAFHSFASAQTTMLWLTVAAVPVVLLLAVEVLRRHQPEHALAGLGSADRLLLVFACSGVALWSVPIESNLRTGQVNLFLALLVLGDVALPRHHPLKGVLIGVAAAMKLTPGLFLVWYALTGRWGAFLRGGITFLSVGALAASVLPNASLAYWPHISQLSRQLDGYGWLLTGANQSVESALLSVTGDSSLHRALGAVVGALIAACAMALAVRCTRQGDELLAAVVCGVAAALMEPVSWDHHWVWALPGLVLVVGAVPAAPGRRLLWAAGYVLLFTQWALVLRTVGPTVRVPKILTRLAFQGPGPVLGSPVVGAVCDRLFTVTGLALLAALTVRSVRDLRVSRQNAACVLGPVGRGPLLAIRHRGREE